MYSLLIPLLVSVFVLLMTLVTYRLGLKKTENAKVTALIGFFLAFLPPLVLIYVVILLLREDTDIV